MDKRLIAIFLFLLSAPVFGQKITPGAQFHKDSVQIGEELPYSLWIRYPKAQDVIFPDSLFDFSPFEINKREYFTTRTDSLESLDSVVYYLSTFEIDTIQYLQLPVFLLDEYDSLELLPAKDSIILQQVVESIPDSVAMIVNTKYNKVPLAFNYPYLIAGIIILLIATIVIYYTFGARIKKMIKVFWASRRHKRFLKSFDQAIGRESIKVEKSVAQWKRYLEKLESKPYTKFTTREIVKITNNQRLKKELNTIDRYIYAVNEQPDTRASFEFLKTFVIERYEEKIAEIKHG